MEDTEIYHSVREGYSLVFSHAQWKLKSRWQEEGYGIRVLREGRIGFAFCQEERDIGLARQRAVELSRFSLSSAFSFCSDRTSAVGACSDGNLDSLEPSGLQEMLNIVHDTAQPGSDSVRIYADAETFQTQISNPFWEKSYRKTTLQLLVEVHSGDGYGYYSFSGRSLPSLSWEAIGEEARILAQAMRHAKRPAPGEYAVIFSPEALHDLVGILLPSFSGDWKRRGISLLADKRDMPVLNEQFSLYEDGTAAASEARPFDDEGVPSCRRVLAENGSPKNFLYDRETAAMAGENETGCCNRMDYSSLPDVGVSNWAIAPGKEKDLSGQTSDYLHVLSIQGTHTANTTTGDFGVEVGVAFHVRGGERQPIRGFLITENIFNLFQKIEGIGSELETYDNAVLPCILFRGIRLVD